MYFSIAQDERLAELCVRRDQSLGKSELLAQPSCFRLVGDPHVGGVLDEVFADPFGAQDSTQSVRGFEQRDPHVAALFGREFVNSQCG